MALHVGVSPSNLMPLARASGAAASYHCLPSSSQVGCSGFPHCQGAEQPGNAWGVSSSFIVPEDPT